MVLFKSLKSDENHERRREAYVQYAGTLSERFEDGVELISTLHKELLKRMQIQGSTRRASEAYFTYAGMTELSDDDEVASFLISTNQKECFKWR